MNVANLLNRTINPFEKPNLPHNINTNQPNFLQNPIINNPNKQVANPLLKNTNTQAYQNNPLNTNMSNINPNNLNLTNINSILASKGISTQDLLNMVKNNTLTNLQTIVSENNNNNNKVNQTQNKTESSINSPIKNKASESTNNTNNNKLQYKIDENKVSSAKYQNSPIDSNSGSEEEQSSQEEERFFMLDKKDEKLRGKGKHEGDKPQEAEKANFSNSINEINLQGNLKLEDLLKNSNNQNLTYTLISNENLKSALIKLLEKGDLASISSLGNSASNLLLNLNASNVQNENLKQENSNDSKSKIKNVNEKSEKASIMKDLGEDKPKDPRRKKKDSK